MTGDDPLLSVQNLEKQYPISTGLFRRQTHRVRAVDGVSFDIYPGEIYGLVGESGCGKTTTIQSILQLEEPTDGEIYFDGTDMVHADGDELAEFRRRVQLVLQNPDSAFDPRMQVGKSIAEPLKIHGMADRSRRQEIVEDILERVGLEGADATRYPHEFSGGEKQRMAIARALILNPDLIIADEPASALDGRTKANVLDLLTGLRNRFDLSIMIISHDIDLVHRYSDRIGIMYLGEIVEHGPTATVMERPLHPYTRVLISAIPSLSPDTGGQVTDIELLTDDIPDATDVPPGCRFHPRCPVIIPPAALEIEGSDWRGIISLRLHLERRWPDRATLEASLPADGPSLTQRLRQKFDLADPISNQRVERAFRDATEAIESGDLDRARSILNEVIETVCASKRPERIASESDHEVACHRYDSEVSGDPLVEMPQPKSNQDQ